MFSQNIKKSFTIGTEKWPQGSDSFGRVSKYPAQP